MEAFDIRNPHDREADLHQHHVEETKARTSVMKANERLITALTYVVVAVGVGLLWALAAIAQRLI